jgi:hypothetical protein
VQMVVYLFAFVFLGWVGAQAINLGTLLEPVRIAYEGAWCPFSPRPITSLPPSCIQLATMLVRWSS